MLKKIVAVAVITVALSACTTQTFVMKDGAATPKTDNAQTFFVYGIGQEQTVQAAQVCGGADKVAKVQTQQTFLNGFLTVITLGIYAPHQARVFCTR